MLIDTTHTNKRSLWSAITFKGLQRFWEQKFEDLPYTPFIRPPNLVFSWTLWVIAHGQRGLYKYFLFSFGHFYLVFWSKKDQKSYALFPDISLGIFDGFRDWQSARRGGCSTMWGLNTSKSSMSKGKRISNSCILTMQLYQTQHFAVFAALTFLPSPYKNPCDYIGPIWIISQSQILHQICRLSVAL